MKRYASFFLVPALAIAGVLFISASSFAGEVSTPVIPTAHLGLPISDPSGLIAYYKCTVTNLSQKTQTIVIDFVNENGDVLPSPQDGYNQQCYPPGGSDQTLQPQATFVATCSVVEWYSAYLSYPEFFQKAVRCRVNEFTGNAANWQLSLCASTPYPLATPTPYFGEAKVCVQGP
mgnify:CR=1 FL=1